MNLQIKVADKSRAADIAMIGTQSFSCAFSPLFNRAGDLQNYLNNTYNINKLEASLRKENNIYLLALVDEKPVAFSKMKKNSLNEHIESIAQMELQKIYVLPGYQGSGIGKALMHAILQQVQQLRPDYLWLDAHVTNTRAIHFYENNGFNKHAKKYFTIGTQIFEYDIMVLPVKAMEGSQLHIQHARTG